MQVIISNNTAFLFNYIPMQHGNARFQQIDKHGYIAKQLI